MTPSLKLPTFGCGASKLNLCSCINEKKNEDVSIKVMKPIDLPIAGGDVAAIVVQPWFCNLDWVKQKKTQTQLLCNSLAGPHYQ